MGSSKKINVQGKVVSIITGKQAGLNSFTMNLKKWIESTNADNLQGRLGSNNNRKTLPKGKM